MADILLSNITLPTGQTYNIKDSELWQLIEAAETGKTKFMGVVTNTLTDGSTTTSMTLVGGGTFTAAEGNVVIANSNKDEFIFSSSKWNLMGSTNGLGKLAFKDSASGSISCKMLTSSPLTFDLNYSAATSGTVSLPTTLSVDATKTASAWLLKPGDGVEAGGWAELKIQYRNIDYGTDASGTIVRDISTPVNLVTTLATTSSTVSAWTSAPLTTASAVNGCTPNYVGLFKNDYAFCVTNNDRTVTKVPKFTPVNKGTDFKLIPGTLSSFSGTYTSSTENLQISFSAGAPSSSSGGNATVVKLPAESAYTDVVVTDYDEDISVGQTTKPAGSSKVAAYPFARTCSITTAASVPTAIGTSTFESVLSGFSTPTITTKLATSDSGWTADEKTRKGSITITSGNYEDNYASKNFNSTEIPANTNFVTIPINVTTGSNTDTAVTFNTGTDTAISGSMTVVTDTVSHSLTAK